MFREQRVLPVIKHMKDVDDFLDSAYSVGIVLDIHLAQLRNLMELTQRKDKQLIIHLDLVQGLSSDEAAVEYLCQECRPLGIISTRGKAIMTAKKKKVLAIQRVFLLDTQALENSFKLIEKLNPDYIEVLPGILPTILSEVKERVRKPILTGGFLRTVQHVEQALEAGAEAVTTSNRQLWSSFEPVTSRQK